MTFGEDAAQISCHAKEISSLYLIVKYKPAEDNLPVSYFNWLFFSIGSENNASNFGIAREFGKFLLNYVFEEKNSSPICNGLLKWRLPIQYVADLS